MRTRYPLALAAASLCTVLAHGQASMVTLDEPTVIDFSTSLAGVNEGAFDAAVPAASATPATGQLDQDAWAWFADGTTAEASGGVAVFTGFTDGGGVNDGGSFVTGLNATDINGQRALGVQPTSGNWTSGSITLLANNNTGQNVGQVAVSYDAYVFNDLERSNDLRFYYSASNTEGSYVEVPSAAVISAEASSPTPTWEQTSVSFIIAGISLADGASLYLRWVGDDISGSGQRDEFAFTNISLTPQQSSGPSLVASVTGLSGFAQTVGTPSATQSFIFSGTELSDDATLTISAPFEVSLNAGFGFGSGTDVSMVGGSIASTNVFVRLNNTVTGAATGTLTIGSPGANTLTIALSGSTASATVPTIYINELMASNDAYMLDPFGEYDDWFELYNPNDQAVDMAGWYVTDNAALSTKYMFSTDSTNAVIAAHGFLLIWADSQPEQGNLHTNFGLSGSGEYIGLTAPDGVTLVDNITFDAQLPDTSYGRSSDGEEPWVSFAVPTPGASNNTSIGIAEHSAAVPVHVWPDPVDDILQADRSITGSILDMQGREVLRFSRTNAITMSALPPGIYVLHTLDGIRCTMLKR